MPKTVRIQDKNVPYAYKKIRSDKKDMAKESRFEIFHKNETHRLVVSNVGNSVKGMDAITVTKFGEKFDNLFCNMQGALGNYRDQNGAETPRVAFPKNGLSFQGIQLRDINEAEKSAITAFEKTYAYARVVPTQISTLTLDERLTTLAIDSAEQSSSSPLPASQSTRSEDAAGVLVENTAGFPHPRHTGTLFGENGKNIVIDFDSVHLVKDKVNHNHNPDNILKFMKNLHAAFGPTFSGYTGTRAQITADIPRGSDRQKYAEFVAQYIIKNRTSLSTNTIKTSEPPTIDQRPAPPTR